MIENEYSRGKLVYIHYTDPLGFQAISVSGEISDKYRPKLRPTAAHGMYVVYGNVRLGWFDAWYRLFLGQQGYEDRGKYIIVFSTDVQPYKKERISAHEDIGEVIFLDALYFRDTTGGKKNAEFIIGARNPFENVIDPE